MKSLLLEIQDSLINMQDKWDAVYFRFRDPEYAQQGTECFRLRQKIRSFLDKEQKIESRIASDVSLNG